MTKYLTVIATVAIPDSDDSMWDVIVDRRVTELLEEMGLPLAPCDWTPDVDTLTDGLGAEYGTVSVLDLNPPRAHPRGLQQSECICDSSIVDGHLGSCPEA